jgi:Domain of unknown function (DUF1858)/Uncharacterized conserved protein (DUF2249)
MFQIPNSGSVLAQQHFGNISPLVPLSFTKEVAMRVTPEMTIKDVLKINEHMMDAFIWISPSFRRLKNPTLRRTMSGRVSVAQAARVGRVPLTEALYVLNLTAGEDEQRLACELKLSDRKNCEYWPDNLPDKPRELLGLRDDDRHVIFVDVMPQANRDEDPRPAIMHGLTELRDNEDVLLVRHAFDPIPLRDLFASRGFASWAEERRPNDWYIYFYRPTAFATAVAHAPVSAVPFVRAAAAGA